MKVFKDLVLWREFRSQQSHFSQSIGFVPTLGNLHAGHEKLLQICAQNHPIRVLSIFLNPTQFSSQKDLFSYPQTLQQDLDLAQKNHVSFVLLPSKEQIYHNGYTSKISHHSDLSFSLEGVYRPGHFDGVLTVVTKLLNLVQPSVAYFGEKDFQQLLLVQRIVDDLFLHSKIASVPTVRENSGLALSSRNSFLSPQNRQKASLIFELLQKIHLSCSQIKKNLLEQGFLVDYVEEKWNRRLAAVHLQQVRLIDNIPLDNIPL